MYRIGYVKRSGGTGFMHHHGEIVEWADPAEADAAAERVWLRQNGLEVFDSFSVVSRDGDIYSEWECD